MTSPSQPLKKWMDENKIDVRSLADLLSFNQSSIYKFLIGNRPASWEFKHRFAVIYGIEKATEIFGEINVNQTAT